LHATSAWTWKNCWPLGDQAHAELFTQLDGRTSAVLFASGSPGRQLLQSLGCNGKEVAS